MDRIKPEREPRQRVQKIWRNVRWAESFPDDALTVDVNDITPTYALRKVAQLFETKKYGECALLIRRLNCVTLSSILHEVPIDVLHDSLPHSLTILEALYTKLFETCENPEEFPKEDLQTDQFLMKLVALFAQQSNLNNKHEKNSNSVYPSCRSILRVILWVEPNTRRQMRTKKRELDKCLRHLGRHGLVESSEGSLMNLHDAFKIEFEKVVFQYRSALHKLEELNLSAKNPTGSSVIWGPAPSSSSHHRLMQIYRDDVQERIIKNRTLYNLVEPAIQNQYLKKFINILEKRIEYDKIVLFYDTEMKKIVKTETSENKFLSVSLKESSMGYGVVLQLLREVTDEDILTEEEEEDGPVVFSDDETISPLMHKDRVRSLSSSSGIFSNKSLSGTRPSIIHIGQTFRQEGNGFSNGYLAYHFQNGTLPMKFGKMIAVGDDQKAMEHEMDVLRAQLDKTQEMVRHLQDREHTCLNQLAELQMQLNSFNPSVHNAERVSMLVAHYQRLYEDDRQFALEALDSLEALKEVHSLKGKILFSVIVLAFRSTQQCLQELRGKVRHLLKLPAPSNHLVTMEDPIAMVMEGHIENYICEAAPRFDVTQCIGEVSSQILATLYDYPCLKECEGLKTYIASCVKCSWDLIVQRPPFTIVYDSRVFNNEIHVRNEAADVQSVMIRNFMWPALLHGSNGPCVFKGIVET
ncbi:uncharacterized protein LOC127858511 [Dreissena polymorpha]|uniref:uncharacterized protein LOC127858511 n=1 Tax=Dreissena polymorpha TaxID=45954 RepID=UPI002264BD56|nr:uncharacterized protein LOC127858511 [Dreissena polymorpha]XP_052251667.1 uncharacterized protein LOC127858511 [Dreissena polymorpha]